MPGVMAAAKAAGKSTGRATSAAGASTTRKTLPPDLPPDPGAHAAKLRAQGQDDSQIRSALRNMGYPAATASNVAPGNARTGGNSYPHDNPPASPDDFTDPPAPAGKSAPTTGRTLQAPGAGDLSGFILGLVGTALLVNFMRGGPAQVKRWGAAKFLNNPGPAPATPGSSGKSGADGGSGFAPGAGAGGGGGGSW